MDFESKITSRDISEILWDTEKTVSTAESCTGGKIAEAIIAVPGASKYFKGGIISYVNEIKERLLGVDHQLLEEKTAVCEEVAIAMVKGACWGEYTDPNSMLFHLCDTRTVLNRIPYSDLDGLVNEPLSDDVACLDIEDASKSRPSDDQVMLLIKEKTGATNSSAFQQLPDEIKRSVLVELKGRRASLRQLERLTGIGKSMIYRM